MRAINETPKRARGDGNVYRRGSAWWIRYSVRGRPVRESAANVLGIKMTECDRARAEQALVLRIRQHRGGNDRPWLIASVRQATFTPGAFIIAGIANSLGGPPALIIDTAELRALTSPIVYAYIRSGKVLYVGLSRTGIARPFSSGHHRLDLPGRKGTPITEQDHVIVWPCASLEAATALERQAIRAFVPTLNGTAARRSRADASGPPTQGTTAPTGQVTEPTKC